MGVELLALSELIRPIIEAKDVGQVVKGSAAETSLNDSTTWFTVVNLTTTSGNFIGVTIRKPDDTTRLCDQFRITVDGEAAETMLCRNNPNPHGDTPNLNDASEQFSLPARFRSAFKLEAKGTTGTGTVELTAQWAEDI